MNELRQSASLEASQNILPWATTEQLALYATKREFIGLETRPFIERVKDHMLEYPDEVTVYGVTGLPVGSGKLNECGQVAADILFDPKFRRKMAVRGKEPQPHYLSLGMGLREMLAEGRIEGPHPLFLPVEFARTHQRLALTTDAAGINLPLMQPDAAHLLIIEFPLSLVGRMLRVNPHTFIKFRGSVERAHKEAADQRTAFDPEQVDPDVKQKFLQNQVVIDKEDVTPADMAWNMGNARSAKLGMESIMNKMVADRGEIRRLARELGLKVPFYERETLEDASFRNDVVLPVYCEVLARRWGLSVSWDGAGGITAKNWCFESDDFIEGNKHTFVQLLQSIELDMKAVREFEL